MKPSEPIHPSQDGSRVWWLLTAITSVAFLTVGALASYHAELRNDQYQLIHLGQVLYRGGRLYLDCWENKPPGIAWVNLLGLWLARGDPIGAWFPLVPMALASLSLFGLAVRKSLGDLTACISVILGAIVYSLRLYDSPSINPDFYSSILELAAFSLWCHAMARDSASGMGSRGSQYIKYALSGLVWLAATLVKQVGCLGFLAVMLVAPLLTIIGSLKITSVRLRNKGGHIRSTAASDGGPLPESDRSYPSNPGGQSVLLTLLGFAIGLSIVVGVLVYQGTAKEAWRAIVSFNTGLANPAPLLSRFQSDVTRIRGDLEPLGLPMWLALLGLLLSLSRKSANVRTRMFIFVAFAWLVLATVFALLGPSRAMRYWLALFPPMLFLASVGIARLIELFRASGRVHRVTLTLVFLTIAIMLAHPLHDAMKTGIASSIASWQKKSNERDRLRAVGNEIRRRTAPEDRIYVWGYRAGVYVYSDRVPASRFVYPRSPRQADEILTALEGGRARLLLLPKGGAIRFDPSCDETCVKRIEQVMASCASTADIGDYRAWICQ